MKSEDTFIENKIQNTFTAYLVKAIQGTRRNYIIRRSNISINEQFFEDIKYV